MTERAAVQDPMLRYAAAIGWAYVSPLEALRMRGGESGLTFSDLLARQLQRLNPGVVDSARAADILRQLALLRPAIEGNRDALAWLRGEMSVFVPAERRERNVRLIDFDNPDANVFQVTDEWAYRGPARRNRADAVFLINGIPVAIAETKAATRREGPAEAVTQLRRYHEETPELVLLPQVFSVTQLLDFYYGVTWNLSRKDLFNWREETSGDYERAVSAFFDRARFLRVLRDYIVFLSKDGELTKVILRQHQTRGVEKVLTRIADPRRRRGLIWHTQGSGKTLTMLTVAARLLREVPGGEKPTILMLVDRNELEAQLFRNIAGYGLAVEIAQSKRDLRRLLAADTRGLIVSMIHKFDDIPADLNRRASIVVLVDEAHRTTSGDLGNYLLAALPNATYIGFTGTPIDRLTKGQGTFKVFGGDDPQGYLDKYSIAESIADGTTVPLNYALAPSELRVDRETLEREFLALAEAQGISDVDELNAILDKAVALKEALKAPGRIDQIARHVAAHFRDNVEPLGFKAFLVAVDREACALYKQALDRYLPPEYATVVYSPAHNDPALLKRYYLEEQAEKDVRKAFVAADQLPKILIVTEKLLTGFDAPVLYCLYLDKPMRDHVLLQAIARVNRPYEAESGQAKPYGLVFDFVGIFEKLEKALAFDSDTVASVIQNIDVLKRHFAQLMAEAAAYLPLTRGADDKSREAAIEALRDKDRREDFFKFFRRLETLYDILSPDAFLRPYIRDYQALAGLYALVRNAYSKRVYADTELAEKTRKLLREHTALYNAELPGAIHTLGPAELAALKASGVSDTTKVLNLRKILAQVVEAEGESKPFLFSIGERADAVAQAYEDRQIGTQQALEQFEELTQEYIGADEETVRLGLDPNTFAIYRLLRLLVAEVKSERARAIDAAFRQFPDFRWDERQKSELRAELYGLLLPLTDAEGAVAAANALLGLKRV